MSWPGAAYKREPSFSLHGGKDHPGIDPGIHAISAYRYAKADPHDLRLNSQWVYPRNPDAFHVSTEDPLDRLEERRRSIRPWRKDQVQDTEHLPDFH